METLIDLMALFIQIKQFNDRTKKSQRQHLGIDTIRAQV